MRKVHLAEYNIQVLFPGLENVRTVTTNEAKPLRKICNSEKTTRTNEFFSLQLTPFWKSAKDVEKENHLFMTGGIYPAVFISSWLPLKLLTN